MAEGFEPYHVPQQSRRDKLRVHLPGCAEPSARMQGYAGFLPLYDPSLLSSDLLTCADGGAHDFHHQNHPLGGASEACKGNRSGVVKEEGENFMGFVGGIVNASSSSSASHHPYFDPQSSLHISPSTIQDINNNPFLYTPQNLQNLRDFEQSYNGGEVLLFKPEPLSLSLSSHQNNLPLELNLQRYGSAMYSVKASADYVASTSNDVSRSPVPLGPFTGYASILKGSRFLRPAQQLLEEFCDVGRGIYVEKATPESALMDSPMESGIVDDQLSSGDGGDNHHGGKKSRLTLMLDEVYRRYKQYYEQLQAVVASFEYVAGLGNAAPYANLALKAMSKHFRCLKNSIMDQLMISGKGHGHISHEKDEGQRFLNTDRGVYNQRSVQNSGFLEHQPVWRPQRGLPERAVTVLRAWLFEHFLHPYPTDTDKIMLAKQTGLSRSQVSNWFINARVRLWKPMVEEIHTLETRQAQKASQREEQNVSASRDHLSSSGNSLASENPSTSTRRVQDTPPKCTRNEHLDHISTVGTVEPVSLSYNNLSRQPQVGVGPSSNVSLTLGLHQNNGIGLPEPFSISAAQRFGLGLEANNEDYVMGNFEAQNRHFGRDVIGGQLLHDFVG